MASITHVYTIGLVAQILDADEDMLRELFISMEPEDGYLFVHGIGDEDTIVFTEEGIENLRLFIQELNHYRL